MVTSLIIPIGIFILGGIALVFTGVRILLKKEVTITSRNTKYWLLHSLLKPLIPGAYDPVSFHLSGWKKTIFGLLLLIFGLSAFIVSWQLIVLASVLSRTSQIHY